MKVICDLRSLPYEKNRATASQLAKALIDGGLVPSYSEEQLNAVEKCLLGLPTIRNKNSGHGTGAVPRDVPEHYVSFALHLAASNIVFLIRKFQFTGRHDALINRLVESGEYLDASAVVRDALLAREDERRAERVQPVRARRAKR